MHRPFLTVLVLACATAVVAVGGQSLTPADFRQDFDAACQNIASMYAYFDDKSTAWNDVPRLFSEDLTRVRSREDLIRLLERVLDELYDPHAQLTVNTAASPRLVPSGADVWAEWKGDLAVVTQVRSGSDAERGGLTAADVILSINDVSIGDAVERRMGRSYPHSDQAARAWALRAVLAGYHSEPRLLRIQHAGEFRTIDLPGRDQFDSGAVALVTFREIRPGVGYIGFNDSLGTRGVVRQFDSALESLQASRALIIDLRNTPGGGNTAAARGILGRFVRAEAAYQKHMLPSEERQTGIRRSWLELVTPREGLSYRGRVAVLVGRWTGSMGEGLAIGFDAAMTAFIVGTPMAGLAGATSTITLPRTGIGINVPVERLYHVNGTARERFEPNVIVDVSATTAGDPFISAGLRAIGER